MENYEKAIKNLEKMADELGFDVLIGIKNRPEAKKEEYILMIANDGYICINDGVIGYIADDGILWLHKKYIQGDLYKKWKDGGCEVDETQITFKGYEFYIDDDGVLRMCDIPGNRIFSFKNLVSYHSFDLDKNQNFIQKLPNTDTPKVEWHKTSLNSINENYI